ncbi:MAG: hypothetical protein ACI4WG_01300 [Erysipelotrichaceae bacterium]
MRKLLLLFIIFALFLPADIFADNKSATINISGTESTYCSELAIVEVHSVSQCEVNNISGTITYDKTVLAVFSVEVSDNLSGWTFTIDTSTAGTIKFTGSSNSDFLLQDRTLFTITFIVHSRSETTTYVKSASVSSTITTTQEVEEEVVINQDEIDAAKANGVPEELWPAPIIEKVKKTVENQETVTYQDSSHSIKVTKRVSDDCYLKELSVEDSTMSPTFNKLTNAYKVTIDTKTDVKINYLTEDPKATVVIQDEINNQIIITVTAENGNNNTYVLTIIRQANYDSSSINNDEINNDINNSQVDVDNPTVEVSDKLSLTNIIVLSSLTALSIIGLSIGSIFIYKGTHQ